MIESKFQRHATLSYFAVDHCSRIGVENEGKGNSNIIHHSIIMKKQTEEEENLERYPTNQSDVISNNPLPFSI